MAVHELRHVLSEARGATEALDRRVHGRLSAGDALLVSRVRESLERVEEVADAVVAYHAVEGPRRIDRVHLEEVVAGAVSHHLEEDGRLPFRLAVSALPVVDGDRRLLLALVRMLVDNAVKARVPGRELALEVSAYRSDGDRWVVSVTDTGIGMADDHERVFHLLEDESLPRPAGRGVGLAASRRIVEAHGGHIWAEPNEPAGTTISFTLPCGQAGSGQETGPATELPAERGPRVIRTR